MVDERRYDSCGNPRSLVSHKHKSCFSDGRSDEDYEEVAMVPMESGYSGPRACREATPIEHAMRRIRANVDGVESILEILRGRLASIMGPPTPSTNVPAATPCDAQSQLGSELHLVADRIADLQRNVEQIVASLDI